MLRSFAKYPEQGMIVGKLVAGYGDLEFSLAECLSATMGDDLSMACRIMFRVRGEEARIQVADGGMRVQFDEIGLINTYTEAVADMHWCRRIRNQ